jgi:hypothetical protein
MPNTNARVKANRGVLVARKAGKLRKHWRF